MGYKIQILFNKATYNLPWKPVTVKLQVNNICMTIKMFYHAASIYTEIPSARGLGNSMIEVYYHKTKCYPFMAVILSPFTTSFVIIHISNTCGQFNSINSHLGL